MTRRVGVSTRKTAHSLGAWSATGYYGPERDVSSRSHRGCHGLDRSANTNNWDSDEAVASCRAYGAFKRRVNAGTRFKDNPKALRAWGRLSHDGQRFSDVCHYCGAHQTVEEREELEALRRASNHEIM